ncbi:MAG: redoxin domain-containing protein [Actinomycetota bacterium]|nr:redoxin domain-containing protein [Actinomycetota bacterium]
MARNSAGQRHKREQVKAVEQARAKRITQIQVWAGVSAAVVGIAALGFLTWPEPEVGSIEAESWDLPALVGDERIALSDFEGKPTVAAFFASWCTVCEGEIPEFLAVSQEIGNDINFVGINTQDNGRGGGDADKWGITGEWKIAKDIGGRSASGLSMDAFGARDMPLTVFYDETGSVAHVLRGGISADQLLDLLEDLFGYTA